MLTNAENNCALEAYYLFIPTKEVNDLLGDIDIEVIVKSFEQRVM